MKRVIIVLVILLLITGCGKKSEEEHYDLKGKDLNSYSYINSNGSADVYALCDMTIDEALSIITGLFYKVGEDDYVLLDTFEFNQKDAYNSSNVYVFSSNKLYGIGNGGTPNSFVYNLEGRNSRMSKIIFSFDNEEVIPSGIKKVTDKEIEISTYSDDNRYVCDLKNYKCEVKRDE